MPTSLRDRFALRLARRPELVPAGSRVLVALSGGPDSMALLHLLLGQRDEHGFGISAAHFDHAARPESRVEAERVLRWAAELGVPCEVGSPSRRLEATQAAFREARYAFLRRVATHRGAARIATGHQADDQVETILLRITRGTGLRGLGGIQEKRGRIVRPLLQFRRDELLEFLDGEGIEYLDDPSNHDPRWARVRIRARVLPALERTIGPDFRSRILSLSGRIRALDRMLDQAARRELVVVVGADAYPDVPRERLRLDREGLLGIQPELRARILRIAASRAGVALSRGGTRTGAAFIMEGRSGSSIDIGGGLRLGREYGTLLLGSPTPAPSTESVLIRAPGKGSARLRLGATTYRARWRVGSRTPEREGCIAVPVRGGHYPYEIRAWRPGDRIRLAGGSRKLKKLFGDRRVPRSERSGIPVLADGDGRVWWVAGVARDHELETLEDHGDCIVVELGLAESG